MEIQIKCQGASRIHIDKLLDFQGNLKELSDENYNKLKKDILELGFSEPVSVWQKDGKTFLLNGHQRVKTIRRMKDEGFLLESIPVNFVEASDELEAKKKVLSLTSQFGEITDLGLETFLKESGVDIFWAKESLRFPEIDFDGLFKEDKKQLTDPDDVPTVTTDPKIKLGDLIEMGNHRLLCGDSTDKITVDKLTDGQTIDLVFTDPPYGINNDTAKGETYNNNKAYNDSETFNLQKLDLKSDYVIWGGNYYDWVPTKRSEIGWVVWDKRPTRESWDKDTRDAADRIFGQHFEIAITNVSGKSGKIIRKTWGGFYGTAGNPEDTIVHRTQKPIELLSHFVLENHKIVLDYFGGSGSTLIACEKTNRKCFMMELDPHYCDVIVTRWCNFTGINKIKINGIETEWSYSS